MYGMGKRHKCDFCGMPACAFQLRGEEKIFLCVNHIPIEESDELPELRMPAQNRVSERER
jgi:hypothetical protein